ncbi:hypothetical protein OV079_19925 [Nannocystis pusilla]|uniref:Uncharacterized protein n=1 Tax=Nannocystis pusilla TaxID=889268 RepID=A0A9X3IY82_9BACT|nr:hypothetical protein [Nannocystis pusilla]MCY1007780.1 hypothetical protein [Nannocystis pusilla]
MYLPQNEWSTPEEGDPPPCFRQGDLIEIDWVRLDYADATRDQTGTKFTVELRRRETVALVGTCCDLVLHKTPKRKGFLVSPLRKVPKHLSKPGALDALKAPMPLAGEVAAGFPNLIYFAGVSAPTGLYVQEGVIYLEALTMVDAITLDGATKLAELTRESRAEFKERLKWHFSRGGA